MGLIKNANPALTYTSGSWGAVGAAAAAGRLLRLDRTALRESLGAADYHGPIGLIMKGVAKPCMAKDGIGWGAMLAMSSVLMAKEGFTAPEPTFDEIPDPAWIDELGKEYRCLNLYFKPYACCRWAQAAITGALKIVKEHSLSLDEISAIRVKTFKSAAALSRVHPQDTEHAQYNLSYPIAAALIDGRLDGAQVLPPRLFDRELLRLADKVEVEVSPEFQSSFPKQTFSEVIIRARDGRELASGKLEPKWEPPDTPTDEELEDKFQRLVGPILGEEECRRLSSLIWNIEDLRSIRSTIPVCRTAVKHSAATLANGSGR
jgi:2-methylcitrate dehydratase PrpD